MKTKIQEFCQVFFFEEVIQITVSMVVIIILTKLCYSKYKSIRLDEPDLQIEHKFEHQE